MCSQTVTTLFSYLLHFKEMQAQISREKRKTLIYNKPKSRFYYVSGIKNDVKIYHPYRPILHIDQWEDTIIKVITLRL